MRYRACHFSRSLGEPEVPLTGKPRSLRFTWSMKTTSSLEPSEMMEEIKVIFKYKGKGKVISQKIELEYRHIMFIFSLICLEKRYVSPFHFKELKMKGYE